LNISLELVDVSLFNIIFDCPFLKLKEWHLIRIFVLEVEFFLLGKCLPLSLFAGFLFLLFRQQLLFLFHFRIFLAALLGLNFFGLPNFFLGLLTRLNFALVKFLS
jgi:hypothetical protein